jgi:hypothetical protein
MCFATVALAVVVVMHRMAHMIPSQPNKNYRGVTQDQSLEMA